MNTINLNVYQFNIVQECNSIGLTLILLLYMLLSPDHKQKIYRYFKLALLANIFSTLGSMSDWLFSGVNTPLSRVMLNIGSSISFFSTGWLLTCYFLFFLAFVDYRQVTHRHWIQMIYAIFVTNSLLSFLSLFFNLYYHIDENGAYSRGPLFIVSIILSLLICFSVIILMWFFRDSLTKPDFIFLSSFYLLPMIAEMIQVHFYGYDFLCIGITLALMLSFIRIQIAQSEKLSAEKMKLQMDNANQTLEMLANAIDAKDPYTRGHSFRVAIYSVLIAKELGWEEDRLEELRFAALLHDIGKIGIPDCILNKPDKLTDIEYNIIKSHTTLGAKILRIKKENSVGATVALYHHERYDGTGYPAGLKGDQIPLVARLVCIADCYDAMNSKRVYRDALSPEYIRNEFIKGRGTQFDPLLTDIFLRLLDSNIPDSTLKEHHTRKNESYSEIAKVLNDCIENLASRREDSSNQAMPNRDDSLKSGPYSVNNDDFKYLTHYLDHLSSRYQHSYEMLDISLSFVSDSNATAADLEKAMIYMHQAIRQSLRCVDIFTPINDNCYRIILLDADQASLTTITERVLKAFYRMYNGIPVKLNYNFIS